MSPTSFRTRSPETRPLTPAERAALDLVQLQARPSRVDIGLEGDGRPPAPGPQGPEAVCLPLPRGLVAGQGGLTHPPRPGGRPEAADAGTVLGIVAATGVQRLEPRSAVNPHRGYPAAHCFFAASVWVVAGGSAWVFDPVHHRLVPSAGEALRAEDPADALRAAVGSSAGALLVVTGQLDAVPERYHELRWSLVLTECGHLAELLVHAARAATVPVRTQDHFVDAELLAALGVGPGSGLVPATVVELGEATVSRALPARASGRAPSPAPADGSAALHALDRLGWCSTDPEVPATDRGDLATPRLLGSAPWPAVVFERSAARANKGMTARPDPLPGAAAHDLVHALEDALRHRRHADLGASRAYLVTGSVEGYEPGLHEILPGGRTVPVSRVDGMAALQEVFSYPRVQMAVDSCPAAVVLTTDYEQLLRDGGPRALRTSQLDNGRALQAAGLALTLHDAFLRPARSYDTDRLATLLGLPPGSLPTYVGLAGQSRFTDLLMDVRP